MVKVTVGFNQQQMQLLEELRREKRFGETYSEVIRSIFAQWLREEGYLDA